MADPHTLTMAAFLALAGQCGEGIAPATLAQLTSTESAFNSLAININKGSGIKPGTVRGIKTKAQAVALATSLHMSGVSFDAGVAQINSKNFEWLGLTPATAFEPCENIKAQAHFLKSFSRYNTGSTTRGFHNDYVKKVVGGRERIRALIDGAVTETEKPHDGENKDIKKACRTPPKWAIGQSVRYAKQCASETEKVANNFETPPIKRVVKEYP